MQFLIMAYDGTDEDALDRRLAVREKHIENAHGMQLAGNLLFAGALLDDAGKMIGTMAAVDFPTREDIDSWLETEPYVTGDVWRNIEIQSFRIGPSFEAGYGK